MKQVILSDEEYKTTVRGMKLLRNLIFIAEYDTYEEIAMHWMSLLLKHEKHLVRDIKDEVPLSESSEDLIWWFKQLEILYD